MNDWIDASDVAVAAVMAEAECGYVGLVLAQPRLQALTVTFEGRTVR